ncbi:FlgD immunoglobulin-like domain containing protein [Ignavibacteriales bacterium]
MTRLMKTLVLILFYATISTFAQESPFSFKFEDSPSNITYSSSENPASNSISAMLVQGDTIWLGTSRGLSRSTDKGTTWRNYYGDPAFGTENISALAWDKYRGILWVATAHSVVRTGQTLPEGSGLRYTSDGGETWQSVAQPLDKDVDTVIVYGNNRLRALPVTVAIQNITYDIAITPGTVWISSFAGGLRKSTDLGATWTRVVLPPDFLNSIKPTDNLSFCVSPVPGKFCSEGYLNYRAFSVMAVNDSVIYAGTANGVNKSTDGGISWVKFNHQNQVNPMSGNFVVGLAHKPGTDEIWAATWKAEDLSEAYGVSFSPDGGANWFTSLDGERVNNFAVLADKVVAAASGGLYKSNDYGKNWYSPGNIVDSDSKLSLKSTTFYSAAWAESGIVLYIGTADGLVKNSGFTGVWPDKWKLYFASLQLESKEDSYAFPNPFSPKTEQVKIKYSTGGKELPVTIRIFDFGMNYLRTVIQNAPRGNPVHTVNSSGVAGVIDFWDGKDDNGKVVPNGVYFYRIDAGNEKPMFGKIMVLQ